ncbi:MAG: hypothetical protein QW275_00570 [Candidatus Anstonellaceae archaeon]
MKKSEKKEGTPAIQDRAIKAAASLYEKLPLLPLLDRQTSALAYIAIAAYIAFIVAIFFLSPSASQSLSFEVEEEPIYKNSPLKLAEGEEYAYQIEYSSNPVVQATLFYKITKSPSCSGVVIEERTEDAFLQSVCVDKDGTSSNFSNISIGEGGMLVFSPWMLAASENFSWKAKSKVKGAVEAQVEYHYSSKGSFKILGRDAYIIEQSSDIGGNITAYIDKEKRILLYLSSPQGAVAKLISAPFPISP